MPSTLCTGHFRLGSISWTVLVVLTLTVHVCFREHLWMKYSSESSPLRTMSFTLSGCELASKSYLRVMEERGYQAALVKLLSSGVQNQTGRYLRLRYRFGYRATSESLRNKDELRRKALYRMLKINRHENLKRCPIWIDAARARAVQESLGDGEYFGLVGAGGALAKCDGRDDVRVFPEEGMERNRFIRGNEHYTYLKHCTSKTCMNKSRPACRKFISGGRDALLPLFRYRFTGTKKSDDKELYGTILQRARVRIVEKSEDACIFVLDQKDMPKSELLKYSNDSFKYDDLEHWKDVDGVKGRNHLLVHTSCTVHCDRPAFIKNRGSLGEAIIVSPVHWHALFRPGFDIAIPAAYRPSYSVLQERRQKRVFEGRHPLVYFRGGSSGMTKWNVDRAVAAAYSHDPRNGVVIETYSRETYNTSGQTPCNKSFYDIHHSPDFAEMMTSTIFGFCPGGGAPYSFRMSEAMASGAIPVVTEDLVLPYEGSSIFPADELWKSCAVYVTSQDLYILGDVLKAVFLEGKEALRRRQQSCERIWNEALNYGTGEIARTYEAAVPHFVFSELSYRLRN